MSDFYLSFGWKHAGLISFGWVRGGCKSTDIHLFPSFNYWRWGYEEDWYDGPLPSFGLGSLMLICWLDWQRNKNENKRTY